MPVGRKLTPDVALCLVCFALWSRSGVSAVESDASVIRVTSEGELRTALQQGGEHVLVTEHLDLTGMRPTTSTFGGYRESDFHALPQLVSIQGACESAPLVLPSDSDVPTHVPGQCLLSVSSQFLQWFDTMSSSDVWLDSLILQYESNETNPAALVFFQPSTPNATLWATGVSFVGGSRAAGAYIGDHSAVFQDCVFSNTSGVAINGTGVVLFNRVDFVATTVPLLAPTGATMLMGAVTATNGSQVAFQATTFTSTTGGADVVADAVPTAVFADYPRGNFPFSVEGEAFVAPLAEFQGVAPNTTDARFLSLQQDVEQLNVTSITAPPQIVAPPHMPPPAPGKSSVPPSTIAGLCIAALVFAAVSLAACEVCRRLRLGVTKRAGSDYPSLEVAMFSAVVGRTEPAPEEHRSQQSPLSELNELGAGLADHDDLAEQVVGPPPSLLRRGPLALPARAQRVASLEMSDMSGALSYTEGGDWRAEMEMEAQ